MPHDALWGPTQVLSVLCRCLKDPLAMPRGQAQPERPNPNPENIQNSPNLNPNALGPRTACQVTPALHYTCHIHPCPESHPWPCPCPSYTLVGLSSGASRASRSGRRPSKQPLKRVAKPADSPGRCRPAVRGRASRTGKHAATGMKQPQRSSRPSPLHGVAP